MRASLPAVLFCVALAGQAQASGYSLLNAGIASRGHRDPDETIRLMTEAIAAPDLAPRFRPVAYLVRGEAYDQKKQYDFAIADFTKTLQLRPDDFDAWAQRGLAYGAQKNFDNQIADYSSAIKLRPDLAGGYIARAAVNETLKKYDVALADYSTVISLFPELALPHRLRAEIYRSEVKLDAAQDDMDKAVALDPKSAIEYFSRAQIYEERSKLPEELGDLKLGLGYEPGNIMARLDMGLVQWKMGALDDATATFQQVVTASPSNAYGVLWLDISRIQSGKTDDDLQKNAAGSDKAKWPAPIVKVFLGTATPDQALKAAQDADPTTQQRQTCEANFYVGEWHLLHQNAALAKPMLEAAANNCPHDFVELSAAAFALKRLP
jgi:lipoprotein NlpI